MKELLISVSIILVLIIGYLLYRLFHIIKVVKGKKDKIIQSDKSNYYNAIAMMVFLVLSMTIVIWYSIEASEDFLPESASEHGYLIDNLMFITFIITGIVFFAAETALFYFAFKYRKTPDRKAFYYPISYRLEIIWTAIPTVTFIGLFILGFRANRAIFSPADEDAVVIEIVGQQFSWMVRYPGEDNKLGSYDFRLIDTENNLGLDFTDERSYDDFMPRQMVIPKGRSIELKIRSRDVIHSVWIPHFRVKMDAVPGMPTRFKFTPTITTEEMREDLGNPEFNFELACAELCGRGHFAMRFIVVVVEEDEFQQWYAEQIPWLAKHPDYLAKIPVNKKQIAYQVLGEYIDSLKIE